MLYHNVIVFFSSILLLFFVSALELLFCNCFRIPFFTIRHRLMRRRSGQKKVEEVSSTRLHFHNRCLCAIFIISNIICEMETSNEDAMTRTTTTSDYDNVHQIRNATLAKAIQMKEKKIERRRKNKWHAKSAAAATLKEKPILNAVCK